MVCQPSRRHDPVMWDQLKSVYLRLCVDFFFRPVLSSFQERTQRVCVCAVNGHLVLAILALHLFICLPSPLLLCSDFFAVFRLPLPLSDLLGGFFSPQVFPLAVSHFHLGWLYTSHKHTHTHTRTQRHTGSHLLCQTD